MQSGSLLERSCSRTVECLLLAVVITILLRLLQVTICEPMSGTHMSRITPKFRGCFDWMQMNLFAHMITTKQICLLKRESTATLCARLSSVKAVSVQITQAIRFIRQAGGFV